MSSGRRGRRRGLQAGGQGGAGQVGPDRRAGELRRHHQVRGAFRPGRPLGTGFRGDFPRQPDRAVPDDPRVRASAEGVEGLHRQRVVGGFDPRHRLVDRLRRLESGARHHEHLARARARTRDPRQHRGAGLCAHPLADRGARRRRRRGARAPVRGEIAAQGRPRGAGRRRRDRLADRGRAPCHRRDHLRGRRDAYRFTSLSFDYVIVGAGSAGCVLASRLTEDPNTNVLLLEAGPRDTNLWIHVPLGYGKLFARTDVNWAYESEPEPELNGRRIFTPRGKVLGGSSSINGLVYIRGQREDFDGWGVRGWGFDDLRPYFEKAEAQLRVSDLERLPICDAFIDAAASLGIPRTDDFNGPSQEGTGYYRATSHKGRRRSTAVAYLREAEKRSNLRVETAALALRVVFNGTTATGIEYKQGGKTIAAQGN